MKIVLTVPDLERCPLKQYDNYFEQMLCRAYGCICHKQCQAEWRLDAVAVPEPVRQAKGAELSVMYPMPRPAEEVLRAETNKKPTKDKKFATTESGKEKQCKQCGGTIAGKGVLCQECKRERARAYSRASYLKKCGKSEAAPDTDEEPSRVFYKEKDGYQIFLVVKNGRWTWEAEQDGKVVLNSEKFISKAACRQDVGRAF